MIVLGRVGAPFGVHGWVRVHAFGDDPDAWKQMKCLWLATQAEAAESAWVSRELSGFRRHGDGHVAKFAGVDDRNAAEALGGMFLGAPRGELPDPGSEEYYWADLIGLDVVNRQQQALGRVDSLLETGANEVLVVKDGERERLLPFIASVVLGVDLSGGRIDVDWGADW